MHRSPRPSASAGRRPGGVLRLQCGHPGELWVLFDWSKERYEGFIADPAMREVVAAAGLRGPPEHTIVEDAGQTASSPLRRSPPGEAPERLGATAPTRRAGRLDG